MRYHFVIFIAIFCFNTAATAQADVDKEARAAFNEGIAAFDDGRLSDALVSFERAYSLRPAFKLLYNIGQAQTELGLTRQAISTFERYLRDGGNDIEPDRKLTVEAELSRLRVLAGGHQGTAGPAAARPDLTMKVSVAPHREENRFMTKAAPWVFGGMAVVTAVCGTVFGVRAASINKTLNAECNNGECPPQYQEDIDSMNGSAVAADVLLISTVVLTATAVSIFAVVRHQKKGESK